MSNMSYCRFRNTLADLRDCYDNLDEDVRSDEESGARRRLIELCCGIFDEFGHEVGRQCE